MSNEVPDVSSPRVSSAASSIASTRSHPTPISLSAHPLLADDGAETSSSGYAVYHPAKTGRLSTPPPAASHLAPRGPLSPQAPAPSPSHHPPPLVSRGSSSSAPTIGRAAARSISEAKEKLQGQNLRAELQGLGIGPESVGNAMVNKLAGLQHGGEYQGILDALTSGKVTLLLPEDKLSPASMITPALFLDHLAVLDKKVAGVRGFATLSGLRGTIHSDEIVLASCGSAHGKSGSTLTRDYTDPAIYESFLGFTCPTVSLSTLTTHFYPTFVAGYQVTPLSIPRPSIRPYFINAGDKPREAVPRISSTGSRLAALFGKAVAAPVGVAATTNTDGSDEEDEASPVTPSSRREVPNLDIAVLTIDKVIRHGDVVKGINKTLEAQLRDALRHVSGLEGPVTIVDKVCSFCCRFQPPASWSVTPVNHRSASVTTASTTSDSFYTRDIEAVADGMVEFFHQLRIDVGRNLSVAKPRSEKRVGPEKDEIAEADALEAEVDAALETLENVITTTLYDRLFSPALASDSILDQDLASRIAGLNLLELGLEHLGVDLDASKGWDADSRTMRDSLEDIVGVAAKELARLQDSERKTPQAKLDVFVNLHKIIVDGLSGIPRVPLKENGAPELHLVREVEMDDAASRRSSLTSSRRPSRPASLLSVDEDAEEDAHANEHGLTTPRPREHHPAVQDLPALQLPQPVQPRFHRVASCSTATDVTDSMSEATTASVFDLAQRTRSSTSIPTLNSTVSTSSADLILPLLIYLIVQYNPAHLVSHLLYCQRFRAESLLQGEASYCATSISAVIEFITGVDAKSLGLGAQLPPVTTARPSSTRAPSPASAAKLRGKVQNVSQELDRFVDTANHQLVNAVDNSYRILFGPQGFAPKTLEDVRSVLDGAGTVASKARVTILRRASSPAGPVNIAQREMTDIPGTSLTAEPAEGTRPRSVTQGSARPSIGDRLASLSGLAAAARSRSNSLSSPIPSIVAPPTPATTLLSRFCTMEYDDLKVADIRDLLDEYKRVAKQLRAAQVTE